MRTSYHTDHQAARCRNFLSFYLSPCLPAHIFLLIQPPKHPPIRLSIYLSIYLSVYPSISSSIHPPIFLPIYSFIYLSLYLSTYLSVYVCIYQSVYLSIHQSIYRSIPLYIYLHIYLSFYVSIYPSICPSIHLHISIYLYICMFIYLSTYLSSYIRESTSWRSLSPSASQDFPCVLWDQNVHHRVQKSTHTLSELLKTDRIMLFRETTRDYSQNHPHTFHTVSTMQATVMLIIWCVQQTLSCRVGAINP